MLSAAAPATPTVNPYAQPTGDQASYAPQTAYASAPAGPPQGLAVTSMVLGIVGLFLGILVSIAAVVTGHMAQKRQPDARTFWLTGLITGYIGILIGLVVGVLIVVWFVFIFSIAAATGTSSF